jgi:hypothetical protein
MHAADEAGPEYGGLEFFHVSFFLVEEYNLAQKLVDWYGRVMVVRIRLGKGPRIGRQYGKNRQVALALAALLTPATVLASVLALWRIAADMNWTNSFAIPSGLFSHWQAWFGMALLLQVCSRLLNRYGNGRGADTATS